MTTIDPRPMLARACDQAGELIATTNPALANAPTPCAEFDVAQLIGHLTGVVRRIGVIASGGNFASVPVVANPGPDEWAAEWAQGRADTDAVLAATDLSRPVQVPWGEVPVADALDTYVGELATHAWDLAVATGRLDQLDPEIAVAALPIARALVPAHIRGQQGIPFGAVVEVGADAAAYDQLVGWNGRDPGWTA